MVFLLLLIYAQLDRKMEINLDGWTKQYKYTMLSTCAMPYLCVVYALSMSCLCLVYVLSMSFLCIVCTLLIS